MDSRQHPPLPQPKKPLGLLAVSVMFALCYAALNELKYPTMAFACIVCSIVCVVGTVVLAYIPSKTTSISSDRK
jgi:hypothetical protein